MEVLQRQVDTTVASSVAFHKETVDMASEFYGEQIRQLATFHKRMCNRYIEDRIPMLSHQLFALQGAFSGLFNAWKSTAHQSEEVHCAELDHFMNEITSRVRTDDNCLTTKFKAQCSENSEWKEKLAHTKQSMIDEFEKTSHYKEIACRESQERLKLLLALRDTWPLEIRTKMNEETSIDMDIATSIKHGAQEGSFEEYFVECLEKRRKEFREFLEFRQSELFKSFERSAQICRKLIDGCLETSCPGSTDFIQEMIDTCGQHISTFYAAAKKYLEIMSDSLQRALLKSRSLASQNVNVKFADSMKLKLEKTMKALRERMDAESRSLSKYRIEKREEIVKRHAAEIAEHERSQIERVRQEIIGVAMNLDLREYDSTMKVIASGGEGTVFRYNLPAASFGLVGMDLISVAAKKFEKCVEYGGTEEILALCKLRHENVARFLGTGLLDGERFLLMEFYPRNIAEEIENCRKATRDKHKFLKMSKFTRWADQIAHALRYIHGNNLIHGDLKPRNILLDFKDVVKLADFGLSSVPILNLGMFRGGRGTKQYMAPEQHAGEKLELEKLKMCDVWAYGIVLWEMITCREPFAEIEERLIPIIIKENTAASHPPLPSECTGESLINVLLACWNPVNIYRFSMYTLSTQFLTDVVVEFKEEFNNDSLWIEECKKWAAATNPTHRTGTKREITDTFPDILNALERIHTILGEIDHSTIDQSINEFLSYRVQELQMDDFVRILEDVVSDIFTASTEKPECAQLYARLCAAQVASELSEKDDSIFRAVLLEYIEKMERFATEYDGGIEEEKKMLAKKDAKDKAKARDEIIERTIKNRKKKFAHITFLGQLYLHDVIPSRTLYNVATILLDSIEGPDQNSESIECALQMLELCGERLEEEISKHPGHPPSFDLEVTFDILTRALPQVSERVRVLIERLLAMRSNGWKHRDPPDPAAEMYSEADKEWLYNNGSDDEEEKEEWEQVRDLGEKDVMKK